MRLWHYKLIPFLPKSQLLAQWRELNSIFKKHDRHILINYVYEYPKDSLKSYSSMVIWEMGVRGYQIKSVKNLLTFFNIENITVTRPIDRNPFPEHHNDEYLTICYYNLLEKYRRGQKDFNEDTMKEIAKCAGKELNQW